MRYKTIETKSRTVALGFQEVILILKTVGSGFETIDSIYETVLLSFETTDPRVLTIV